MATDTKEKSKIKLIHEQMFDELGIDPKSFNKNELAKPIPKDWISEIIDFGIKEISIQPISKNFEKVSNTFQLIFNSNSDALLFDKEFTSKFTKAINKYLENKNLNPTEFIRIITLESNITNDMIVFRF